MKVTALLVSHNGARWLPAVLSGLEQGTRQPDRYVAVDTGSNDDSAALVGQALGTPPVALDSGTSYADAVRAGLASAPALAADPDEDEWVWLLHDDANPDPRCLERLVEAVSTAARSDVVAVGPKIREWPSLKRLLEVGVTLSGTGARETGLERGEYDQGQHDQQHDVLAVNTAGMLVRRDVLEQIGLDPHLPIFGNDLDFGWRIARAGKAVRVVPEAMLFHVEAARRGLRDSALVSHPRRQERGSALFTLLANTPAQWLPFRILRMVVGSLLRTIGLLLVRAPGEAGDELAALAGVLLRPDRVLAARRQRRPQYVVPHKQVRHLLSPFWLPYRHGLDFVSDVAVAVADTVREAQERRRGTSMPAGTPRWRRALAHPGRIGLLLAVVLAVIVGREWLSGEPLHGGALLPAPDGVRDWWSLWAARWHDLGTGTDAPAPPYVLLLAVLGTLLLGSAGLVVTGLFVLAVPLSYAGALWFFRKVTGDTWTPVWAAVAYALLPVVGGAVQQGRLGTVAGAVILPWIATTALGLVSADAATVRRATWRTALGLALLTAFVPPAWVLALLLAGVLAATGWGRAHLRELAIVLGMPLLLALPWVLATVLAPGAWLVEGGKAGAVPTDPGILDLLLGRAGGPAAAPAWIGAGLLVAGTAALLRSDTRARVVRAWVLIAAAAALLALVTRLLVSLPGVPYSFHPYAGFLVLVVQAGLVTAAALAATGITSEFAGKSFTWRQPVAGIALLGALASTVAGALWWVADGHRGPLDRDRITRLPVYMTELEHDADQGGTLLLTGGPVRGIRYLLLRSGPLRTGEDGVLALSETDEELAGIVESLMTDTDGKASDRLAQYGVQYVFAPAPVADAVSGGLDAAGGLSSASAPAPGTRAWRVEHEGSLDSLDHDRALLRPLFLVIQLLTLIALISLAVPERLLDRRQGR